MRGLIYTYSLHLWRKTKEKNSEVADEKNWVKQKKKVNKTLWQKGLFENSIYIGHLYVQTKIVMRTYPLSSSTPVTVFAIAEKLINKSKISKFSDVQFVFINVLWNTVWVHERIDLHCKFVGSG